MVHYINEQYAYSESKDMQGKTYYDLWDFSVLHGQGSLRGPKCVATSYNLNEILNKAN